MLILQKILLINEQIVRLFYAEGFIDSVVQPQGHYSMVFLKTKKPCITNFQSVNKPKVK